MERLDFENGEEENELEAAILSLTNDKYFVEICNLLFVISKYLSRRFSLLKYKSVSIYINKTRIEIW